MDGQTRKSGIWQWWKPGSICYSAVVTLKQDIRNQLPNIARVDSTPARFSAKKLFLPAKRHTLTQPLCYQHVEEQSDWKLQDW
jgi:hypothetical protein